MLAIFVFTGLTLGAIVVGIALMVRSVDPADIDRGGSALAIIAGGVLAGSVGVLVIVAGLTEVAINGGGILAAALIAVPLGIATAAAVPIARRPRSPSVPDRDRGSAPGSGRRPASVILGIAVGALTFLAMIVAALCLLLDADVTGATILPLLATTVSVPASLGTGLVLLRASRTRQLARSVAAPPSPARPNGSAGLIASLLIGVDAVVTIAVILSVLGLL